MTATGITLAVVSNPPDLGRRPVAEPTDSATPFFEQPTLAILDQAVAATVQAQTARLRFTIQEPHNVVRVDVRRSQDGSCVGTYTSERHTAEVIATGDHLYLRGDAAYWRYQWPSTVSDAMVRVPERWARFPKNSEFLGLCDIAALLERADLENAEVEALRISPQHPYRGFVAVSLEAPDSSITIVVDAKAPHLLHELSDSEGELYLDEFDEPVSVEIPARGEYVPFTRNATSA